MGPIGEDGAARAGTILRNDNGAIIFSACRALFSCRDELEAELCVCMKGLSFSIREVNCQLL